ncbi:hypothetical protein ACWFMI_14955 [Nocardiopsis terrae]
MSATRIQEMRNDLILALADVSQALGRVGIHLPAPSSESEFNASSAQMTLCRAQRRVEDPRFLAERCLTNGASLLLSTMIHGWLAAADQAQLYAQRGAFPWRDDAFEQHRLKALTSAEAVTILIDSGAAWGRVS